MQQYASEVFVPARPTGSFEGQQTGQRPDPRPEPRHARLFELIRQENLSGVLSVHIDSQCDAVDTDPDTDAISDAFLEECERSLGFPAQAA